MMRIVTLTTLLLLSALGCSTSPSHSSPASASQSELRTPPNPTTAYSSVPQMLQVYAQLSSAKVEAGEGVRESQVNLKVPPYPALTRSQAIKLIEKILHDQAGIIVTHPNPNVVLFKLKKHHT